MLGSKKGQKWLKNGKKNKSAFYFFVGGFGKRPYFLRFFSAPFP